LWQVAEYTISEAAAILGVSKAALRSRVHRRRIEARKDDDGQWYITLPDDAPATPATPRPTAPATDAIGHDIPIETPDQVADLRAEVLFLRRHIEHLTVLLQNEQRQIPASASPEALGERVGAGEDKSLVSSPNRSQRGAQRGLRGFWKRIIGSE
jgi:hypothetical protein